jgi:SAM-dependent methyltransferase
LLGAADGRRISSGSVFSTILLAGMITEQLDASAGTLLDVGCGASPYRVRLTTDRYVGVDRAPVGARGRGDLVIGDASELPFTSRAFEAILCTEVIEHVADERVLAIELARVARPGARLLLSSPFVHGLHEQPNDFRRLTSIGLVTTLDRAGWDVDRVISVGGPVVVAVDSAVRWMDSAIRGASRRMRGRPGPGRVSTWASRRVQQGLAAVVLASGRSRLGPVDPFRADPRLTLGYVVVATRAAGGRSASLSE